MKKNDGFALLSLMLAFSIGAVLFLSIQRIYIWLTNATHNVRSNAVIEHEKMVCYYHMGLDCRNALVTKNFNRLCAVLNELSEDKEGKNKTGDKDKTAVKQIDSKNKEKDEKKKEALEKEFKKIAESELPFLRKEDNRIIFSFLSSRGLLHDKEDNKKVRIEYYFEKVKDPQLGNSFAFKRKEIYDNEEQKNKKSYTLLSYVENPSITLIFLEYEKEKDEKKEKDQIKEEEQDKNKNEKKEKKNIPTVFKKAIEKAHYISVDNIGEYTVDYCQDHSLIPYYVIIEGDMHVQDKKKTVPFVFYFPFAVAESAYEIHSNYPMHKKQKDKKRKDPLKKDKDSQQKKNDQQENSSIDNKEEKNDEEE